MSEQKHSTSDGAAGGTKPPLKKREKRKKPQEGGMEHLSSRIWKKQQPEGRALGGVASAWAPVRRTALCAVRLPLVGQGRP